METIQRWLHYKTEINELEAKNAKLVAALKAVAQRKLKDGTFCWCGMGYSVEDVHYPFCKQAREVLREIGELR